MGFRAVLTAVGLMVLAPACSGPSMRIIEDPTTGRTSYQVYGLFAEVSDDHVGPHGNLGLGVDMHITHSPKDTVFYMNLLALSSMGWSVAPGDTLGLVIDGRRSCTTCGGTPGGLKRPVMEVQHRQYEYDLTGGRYEINRQLLQEIANARTVEVEIHTSGGIVPAELTESNLAKIRQFLDKYVQ